MRPDDVCPFEIVEEDWGVPRPTVARIHIVQPNWDEDDWSFDQPARLTNKHKAHELLRRSLLSATQSNSQIIVFPELSIPSYLEREAANWTISNRCIVVAGSHYHKEHGSLYSRCPVSYQGNTYYIDKVFPAPSELSPIKGEGIQKGSTLRIFKNTPVGDFAVLICSDYLNDSVKHQILKHKFDILIILAFQKDSSRYHNRINVDIDSAESDIFAIYNNNHIDLIADGRSSLFGVMDNIYRERLVKDGHTDSMLPAKLFELAQPDAYLIADLDLANKRPKLRRSVHTRPNVTIIKHDSYPLIQRENERGVSSISLYEAKDKISKSLRGIVARHGLDDAEWVSAFSSMYFLVIIGQKMGLKDSSDYRNLLDAFLAFFNFRSDDTIYLREDNILVTPDENRRMRECMIEEDLNDGYFLTSAKTRAENIDMDLMHENYLYSVALGISATEKSNIMRAIKENAINKLLYEKDKDPLEPHGGWYPYRVPWITARILTSLSAAEISTRSDKQVIQKKMNLALNSLLWRLHPDGHWRSGAGKWVSDWESTALCLEAFLSADSDRQFGSALAPVIENLMGNLDAWMATAPSFEEEGASNATLASALLCSVLIRCEKYYDGYFDIDQNSLLLMHDYLYNCLSSITGSTHADLRQFCTIPQIAAYSALAVAS